MTADGTLAKINRPASLTMLRDRMTVMLHLLQDVQGCSLKGTKESMALQDQITVKGTLDEDWSDWFDGLRITHDAAGDTHLMGAVRDQTALNGLIATACDLGLLLIAVEQRPTVTESDPLAPPVT